MTEALLFVLTVAILFGIPLALILLLTGKGKD
jgi:hypothetical protein